MRTLVVYNSTSGNTKAVAEYIASKTDGVAVNLKSKNKIELGEYVNVYVGSRVHASDVSKTIANFIEKNREMLTRKNARYFVCCTYSKEKGDKQLQKIKEKHNLPNCVYFSAAKKIIANGGKEIDDFIS